MRIGIVGLPNAGKSSLFNALTRAGAAAASYPFTTVAPNVAVVPVPDDRLDAVAETVGAAPVVPETIAFHDIAGLVRGASRGEGLGNRFLANIRETDAIVHVVRTHGDVGRDGGERIARRSGTGAGQGVEERRLAGVRQADDPDPHRPSSRVCPRRTARAIRSPSAIPAAVSEG